MKRFISSLIVVLVSVALLTGCGSERVPEEGADPSPAPVTPAESTPDETAASESASNEVTLVEADRAALDALLEQHRGKVILVDCWATWCGPCMKQFPHTLELHRQHADAGLVVVTLNFDEIDDRERVEQFLDQQQATTINLASRSGLSPEAFDEFEITGGALPHYKLYDRQGNLAEEFVSGDPERVFEAADIDAAVERLL